MDIEKIWIVIPVFNRKEFTRNCLKSLNEQTIKGFNILIFDDGSSDGTSEMIRNEFPEVEVIVGEGDYWWSKSINFGITHALKKGAQAIIALNNDLIVDEKMLENIIICHDENPISLIGCTGYDVESGECKQAPIAYSWLSAKIRSLAWEDNNLMESFFLPARGLFIPSDVFKSIGMYDDINFPQSSADYEFSYRARKKGYKLLISKDSKVFYYEGETGIQKFKKNKNLRNLFMYFFSIRSAAQLPVRWKFAIRCAPWYLIPSHILLDTLRLLVSYFK